MEKSLYHKISYPRAVVPLPLDDGIEDLVAIHGANIGVRNSLGILLRKTICAPSEVVETKDHSASDASDLVDQVWPLGFERGIPQGVCRPHTQRYVFEFFM